MVLFKKEREASDLPIQSFESLYPKSKSEHSKQFKKDSSFAPYINIHTIHMKKKKNWRWRRIAGYKEDGNV